MKKNHFIFSYSGNKRNEVEKIYNQIKNNLNDVKYIVEPFCGTSALSYYISTLHPNQFTYVLNDNNKDLIDLYELLKNTEKTNELINDLNKLINPFPSKELYKKICSQNNITSYVFKNKIYSIRPGLYPQEREIGKDIFNNICKSPIVNFLKNENVILKNDDWFNVYENYKENENALIFLDPPYIDACNGFYKNPKSNVYEYLFNNDINLENANICLCLENIWIIKLLFKNYNSISYDKTYYMSKKNTTHIIVLNSKFPKT